MKPLYLFSAFLVSLIMASCSERKTETTLISPDGTIQVEITESNDSVFYSISKNGAPVVKRSSLGIQAKGAHTFNKLTWNGTTETDPVHFDYTLFHGKRHKDSYKANKKTIFLENESGKRLDILFQVSNDGVAFKYIFPDVSSDTLHIDKELTSFHFPDSARAWLQPMSVAKSGWKRTNPSYEEYYSVDIPVGTPSPTSAGWVYPALFKVGNNWVLITETGLKETYCGSRLAQHSDNGIYHVDYPPKEEGIFGGPVLPESTTPWETPWRVIAIGSLKTLVESNLGAALADPPIEMDTTFIKPGLASWSWAILKDGSVNYDTQKQFIDFASEMNWQYSLVDVDWDTTIGYEKIAELAKYAESKHVGLILWYNSSGDWNDTPYHPKSKLLTSEDREREFSRIHNMGIKGVKVDFFGGDGQSVIKYYHDIMKDAAKYKLLVNFHGATLPRGWQRTYPNLMTMESIKGFEFLTFEQSNADHGPEHCTIIPFTRNVFDPMDFTPMNLTSIPNIIRRDSPAFELALPVLFLSGIQHIAETPKILDKVPEYVIEYLKDIPTNWDNTIFLDGFPGKYVALARQKDSTWFVTGINSTDQSVTLTLDLSFVGEKNGYVITDGTENGFKKVDVTIGKIPLDITIAQKGGFVMKF